MHHVNFTRASLAKKKLLAPREAWMIRAARLVRSSSAGKCSGVCRFANLHETPLIHHSLPFDGLYITCDRRAAKVRACAAPQLAAALTYSLQAR